MDTSTTADSNWFSRRDSCVCAEAEDDETLSSVPAKDKLVKLTARVIPQNDAVRPLSGDEIKKSKDKLWTMSQAATRKAAREEARNAIESYLYRVRDLVEEPAFTSVSKDAERSAISAKTDELAAWLGDEGETADTSTLKLRRASLETLIKPLETRVEQSRLRAASFDEFEATLTDARAFVAAARANLTAAIENNESSKYSLSELDSLEATIDKDADWFSKGKALQAKKGPADDPALLTTDVDARRRKINETIGKIKKRRIAKTRPQKKKASNAKDDKKEDKKEEKKQEKKKDEEQEAPRHEEL